MNAQPTATIEALRLEASEPNQLNKKDYLDREQVGDAELFASLLCDRIAYDHSTGKWYLWRGQYWTRDRNGELKRLVIQRLAPEYMTAAADALRGGEDKLSKEFTKRAQDVLKLRRIKDVLELAANMEAVALTGDEWDQDPMRLGTNNGVLDLTTGTLRNAQPREYLRVYAPADWLGIDEPAPAWEKFLSDVFGGDCELIEFMQRLFGYCLTGQTTEHRLPILYGEGRNGKSTLLQALAAVIGNDLSHTTAADALMDTKRDGSGAQPFIYALRGKRLVWATESKEGQRINAGLIKQLTGGDSITARTLFSDVVTFTPNHKVMLLTNHKPHMSAEDQALWDRVLLIPFDMRFVDEPRAANEYRRDPDLLDKLKVESSGILAWLVRGCLAWQLNGLKPPARVIAATEDYRAEEDTLGEFVADCLLVGEGRQAQAKEIYSKYTEWAKDNGVEAMSQIALGKRLARRFGQPTRNTHGKIYNGIGVLM